MADLTPAESLHLVTNVIQTALTPVFLLTGVGSLLNVFGVRLGRVADHHEHIAGLREAETDAVSRDGLDRHLQRLRRRRTALDSAVMLGALAGAFTCAAAFALFLLTWRDEAGGPLLLWLFGAALIFTIAALGAFLVDTVLAWHGFRRDGPMPRQPG